MSRRYLSEAPPPVDESDWHRDDPPECDATSPELLRRERAVTERLARLGISCEFFHAHLDNGVHGWYVLAGDLPDEVDSASNIDDLEELATRLEGL